MKTPTWITPALSGAALGALAVAIVGFGWGGWQTGGGAQAIADRQSAAAIATALTPYCTDRAQSDPLASNVIAELQASNAFGRRAIVEKAGWATPLGSTGPNRDLAQACQLALAASF